jgi:hypothetical protein
MATVNTSKRLTDKAEPWIAEAIKEHGNGEPVIWELGITAFPDPSVTVLDGNSTDLSDSVGSLPALVLFLELPTEDPTITAYAAPILAPFGLTERTVNQTVKVTLEVLRAARAARAEGFDTA